MLARRGPPPGKRYRSGRKGGRCRAILAPMNPLLSRIGVDPEICHGKPTIRGLRYPVELILELLSSGMTTEEILADYEDLEREDILAVAVAASLSKR